MKSKVSVIGAGNVGATTAQRIVEKGYADVVLMDIVQGMPQGKALDMLQAGPILGFDSHILGTNNYEDTAGSNVVVITSGAARSAGMTRAELMSVNKRIVTEVTRQVVKHSPRCIIVMVTNPLDAMALLALRVSGFPRNRVVGMAGILDTARFRTFVARELKVSVNDVVAYVLGGHGESMVPVCRSTTVAGVQVNRLVPREKLLKIVERTRAGGTEIVDLLKNGSAYYAPAAAIAQMVESILLDKKQILPCTAYLDGEYGIDGIFIGVPVKLGRKGVEKIVQLRLSFEEESGLQASASTVRELVSLMDSVEPKDIPTLAAQPAKASA